MRWITLKWVYLDPLLGIHAAQYMSGWAAKHDANKPIVQAKGAPIVDIQT